MANVAAPADWVLSSALLPAAGVLLVPSSLPGCSRNDKEELSRIVYCYNVSYSEHCGYTPHSPCHLCQAET